MGDRVKIPKTDIELGGKKYPSPAWWLDEDGFLLMRCNCGDMAGLGNHTVEPNGDVNPSIWHDEKEGGCGWHVWGCLEDWKGAK